MEAGPFIRWKLLPAQIIKTGDSVILKRGSTEIRFRRAVYAERLTILSTLAEDGLTEREIFDHYEDGDHFEIRDLLDLLRTKKLLVQVGQPSKTHGSEDHLDIFYWHFDGETQPIKDKLKSRRIVVLGANALSRDLSRSLYLSGFNDITIVNYPHEENLSDDAYRQDKQESLPYHIWMESDGCKKCDCLIATSDFGGRVLLREWNELAIKHQCHFFPVVLQDSIAYLGPLVIPGETACYECLVARENSHLDAPLIRRGVEQAANDGRHIVGIHPSMISVMCGVAAFELTKFYGEMISIQRNGVLIEVNLLSTSMRARRVLRIPRCIACSNLLKEPSVSLHKPVGDASGKAL